MAFLKKSGPKQAMAKGGGATSCPVLATEEVAAPSRQVSEVVPPNKGWLHMDVLEKEKLEWTTDVPSTSSKPDMDAVESRFSLMVYLYREVKKFPSTWDSITMETNRR